jgi:hypothetical protein
LAASSKFGTCAFIEDMMNSGSLEEAGGTEQSKRPPPSRFFVIGFVSSLNDSAALELEPISDATFNLAATKLLHWFNYLSRSCCVLDINFVTEKLLNNIEK